MLLNYTRNTHIKVRKIRKGAKSEQTIPVCHLISQLYLSNNILDTRGVPEIIYNDRTAELNNKFADWLTNCDSCLWRDSKTEMRIGTYYLPTLHTIPNPLVW